MFSPEASLLSLAVTNRVSVDFLSFPYYNDLVREVTIFKVSLRIATYLPIFLFIQQKREGGAH